MWEEIVNTRRQDKNKSCFMLGDFNVVRNVEERKG